MKCLSEKCSFYNGTMTGNCTNYIEVEKCTDGIIKPDNTFFIEWIPVTDEEKPGRMERVFIRCESFRDASGREKEFADIGFLNNDLKIYPVGDDGTFYKNKFRPEITHWARITLPGVEQ